MSVPFIMVFDEMGDFAAYRAACSWLSERGYSYGSMCRGLPTAVMFGDYDIAKWKNLTAQERREVDGLLTAPSYRNGPVTLSLRVAPMEGASK